MILYIIGNIFIFLGVLLFLLSGTGLLRMPDTLTRMQAATKASTLGSITILIGVAFLEPNWAFKLAVLAVFIMITNPISSSILAMTTYKRFSKYIYNSSNADAFKELKEAKEQKEEEI